jgi:small-conductance mechanosensitive channel
VLIPLSKEAILLQQYRSNLFNWRASVRRQYHEAAIALAERVGVLLALLAIVVAAGEIWRRLLNRYVHEQHRRYQMLLLRRITLWTVAAIIVGLTFVTELSSLATFAGLITAGVAVAMQSVLVSIVGYFFLIGKYGVRVGDKVQIGNVTGEVIDIGLVRMHLLELGSRGPLERTGRTVAFANSIAFQSSGGLFKQIPGVNLAWHEITLALPAGSDYALLKKELLEAVGRVLGQYREDFIEQSKRIDQWKDLKTRASIAAGEMLPQIFLRFAASGVEALVRYPVPVEQAVEVDDRVSESLLNVLGAHERANRLPLPTK